MSVDGTARGARLSGRARDIEKDENRQIPSLALAFDIDGLVRVGAGDHLHIGLDGRIDVEVVALGLTVMTLQVRSQTSEGPPQGPSLGKRERGRTLDVGPGFHDGAPLLPVAMVMDIPLGI